MDRDAAVEQRIQDAGCNAPRLTPADIERVIVATTFTTMPAHNTTRSHMVRLRALASDGSNSSFSWCAHTDPAVEL